MTKRTRKGFSMVELLLLLLFVSLITAALTPVVTRKHFKTPKPTNHGSYACYYRLIFDNNGKITGKKLHETRLSGKALTTTVFDRDVTQCTFEPPQKVSYFHVSAIGGGGGGGDSGYNGGAFSQMGPYTENLSPIGITEYMVSTRQRDITAQDFKDFGGQLYGFVVGAASGKGGDQLYVNRHDSRPCTKGHNETYTHTTTTIHYTSSCTGGWETVTVENPTSNDSGGGESEKPGGSDSDQQIDPTVPDHKPGDTPDNPTAPDPGEHTVTPGGGGDHWVNRHPNGSGTDMDGLPNVHEQAGDGGIPTLVPGNNHFGGEASYNIKDKKLKLDLPKFRYFNPDNHVAMLHPTSKYAFLFSANDLLAYSYEKCKGYSTTSSTSSSSSVESKYVCDEYKDYYSYTTAAYTGAAGAAGAVCRSNYKHGGVGLNYSVGSVPASGSDGKSCYPTYNLSPEYDSPHYTNTTTCSGNCAENGHYVSGNSSITFAGENVTAQNATSGGAAATCSGNGSPAGSAGTSCNIAKVTEGCAPGRYGYCLQRWNKSTWEPNTTYEFKFTFSQNYLQYGLAGEQGQYKTMVIRSFKDKNIAISVGSGGSKGVDGGTGVNGQITKFGDIVTAEGGEGGEGGKMTAAEWLEGYRTGAESWPAGVLNAKYEEGKRIVRQEGGVEPEKPKPNNLSSNILNFFAPQDSKKVADILDVNRIGYGGKGGGSIHNCWFGEYRKWLDGGELEHSYALPPTACRNNWKRIEAEDGHSGAVIIRW